jgi:hypothetical protein
VTDADRYEVDLVCEACGCVDVAVRFHSEDPYPDHPYVCPNCVVEREGR